MVKMLLFYIFFTINFFYVLQIFSADQQDLSQNIIYIWTEDSEEKSFVYSAKSNGFYFFRDVRRNQIRNNQNEVGLIPVSYQELKLLDKWLLNKGDWSKKSVLDYVNVFRTIHQLTNEFFVESIHQDQEPLGDVLAREGECTLSTSWDIVQFWKIICNQCTKEFIKSCKNKEWNNVSIVTNQIFFEFLNQKKLYNFIHKNINSSDLGHCPQYNQISVPGEFKRNQRNFNLKDQFIKFYSGYRCAAKANEFYYKGFIARGHDQKNRLVIYIKTDRGNSKVVVKKSVLKKEIFVEIAYVVFYNKGWLKNGNQIKKEYIKYLTGKCAIDLVSDYFIYCKEDKITIYNGLGNKIFSHPFWYDNIISFGMYNKHAWFYYKTAQGKKLLFCQFNCENKSYSTYNFSKDILDLVINRDTSKLNIKTVDNEKCILDLNNFSVKETKIFNIFDINSQLGIFVDYNCDAVYHQRIKYQLGVIENFYLLNEQKIIFVSRLENKNNVTYIIKDPLKRSEAEYRIAFENNFVEHPGDNTCIKIVSFYFNSELKNYLCFKTLDFCTKIKDIHDFDEINEKIIEYKEKRSLYTLPSNSTYANEFELQKGFLKNYYIVPLYHENIKHFFENLPERSVIIDNVTAPQKKDVVFHLTDDYFKKTEQKKINPRAQKKSNLALFLRSDLMKYGVGGFFIGVLLARLVIFKKNQNNQ